MMIVVINIPMIILFLYPLWDLICTPSNSPWNKVPLKIFPQTDSSPPNHERLL